MQTMLVVVVWEIFVSGKRPSSSIRDTITMSVSGEYSYISLLHGKQGICANQMFAGYTYTLIDVSVSLKKIRTY